MVSLLNDSDITYGDYIKLLPELYHVGFVIVTVYDHPKNSVLAHTEAYRCTAIVTRHWSSVSFTQYSRNPECHMMMMMGVRFYKDIVSIVDWYSRGRPHHAMP